MKFTALILSVVSAVALTSCCCQTQAMPKLRKMPTDLVPEEMPGAPSVQPGAPTEPVKVLDGLDK